MGLSLIAWVPARAVAREAITVRLIPDAATVQQGDTLGFELRFVNTGSAPVNLWVPRDWGSVNEPKVLLLIRAASGEEMVLEPLIMLQGTYLGPEEYVVLAPRDSVSLRLEYGGNDDDGPFRRRVDDWRLTERSHPRPPAGEALGYADVWVGFAGPKEYTVRVEYDLRGAAGPLLPLDAKPDSSSTVPPLRKLLHAGVRVVVTGRH